MKKVFMKFFDALNSDTESVESIDERLNWIYKRATKNEKLLIDDVFITLCGWSYKTLTKRGNK